MTTMACTHVVEYDCQGRDCPVSQFRRQVQTAQQAICREAESCARRWHIWRNLGHLEREESWLRCEVRSLLCHVHERQSSQDLAQLESA